MAGRAQKFIIGKTAARIHTEYDLALYGAVKPVQLPFVLGLFGELTDPAQLDARSIEDPGFFQINVEGFSAQPDMTDAAIEARNNALHPLLQGHAEFSDLITYLEGATADAAPEVNEQTSALDALRAMKMPEPEEDTSGSILESLRATAAPDIPEVDESATALDALRSVEIAETPSDDGTAALDALRAVEVAQESQEEDGVATLDALRDQELTETAPEDSGAALDALRAVDLGDVDEDAGDSAAEALDALRAADIPTPEAADQTDAILAGIEEIEIAEDQDTSDSVLAGIEVVEDIPQTDDVANTLAGLEAPEEVEETDDLDVILSDLEAPLEEEQADRAEDILAGIEAVEEAEVENTSDAVLASIETVEDTPQTDDVANTLAGLEAPEEVEETDDLDAILSDLEAPLEEEQADRAEDILAGIEAVEEAEVEETSDAALASIKTLEDTPQTDDITDALAGLEAPEEVEEDNLDAILSDLEIPEAVAEEDDLDAVLSGLDQPDAPEVDDGGVEDVLAGLDIAAPVEDSPEDIDDILSSLDGVASEEDQAEVLDTTLAGLQAPDEASVEDIPVLADEEPEPAEDADIEDVLADLEETPSEEDALDALLADPAPADSTSDGDADDLEALLDDIGAEDSGADEDLEDLSADVSAAEVPEEDEFEGVLDGLGSAPPVEDLIETPEPDPETPAPEDTAALDGTEAPLDDALTEEEEQAAREMEELLADLQPDVPDDEDDDLDALLGALEDSPEEEEPEPAALDDLDALLAGLEGDIEEAEEEAATDQEAPAEAAADDMDALLDGLETEASDAQAPESEQNAPPAAEDDLDALLDGLDADTADNKDTDGSAVEEGKSDMPADTTDGTAKATLSSEPEFAFGAMSGERPDAQRLERKRFRIALLGDFTGRSAQGLIEVGDALAARKPILLDTDTVEDVIEGFATTLVLPIGKDGAGVEVKLGGLDDLHPDELYENVELFAALKSLKSQLGNGGTAESAAKSLIAWGEQHGRAVAPARATSGGNTVRADLKLSDFQKLIGDTEKTLAQPSPVDELMARVVGPHIRKLPDPDVTAMAGAVDDALSGAMRMVLHHPEFQSVEAQWRALDLIARSIETDDTLEVMLYDVSAEEIAADLTQSDDLSTSGLARLLTEGPMDEEFGRGAYSALIGMYTFEETPPHAQLLGRIARVAAHVDAPFFAAITPSFIETPKQDRHPLVAKEWDTLRAMPEARHLALATPRFLMRRPYGAKTEPICEFDFEEFTQSAGLSGMLWANPVVLVAILLAKSFKENGPSMGLGEIMSLGDMPYHFVLDRYGDQVALPCTERNLTLDKVETVLGRGYLPVVSIKGRDDIRLASFQSLGGGEILGPWSGVQPPPPSAPTPPKAEPEAADGYDNDAAGDDDDLDDLLSGFDLDADDNDEDIDNDEDMDAELAALLADL